MVCMEMGNENGFDGLKAQTGCTYLDLSTFAAVHEKGPAIIAKV
jgi:hypothetical protein